MPTALPVRALVALHALLLLAACNPISGNYEQRVHVVKRGETLYQIAWQHGLDRRDLARWNGIRNPDVIHVGDRLRLGPPVAVASAAPAPRAAKPPPARGRAARAATSSAAPPPAAPALPAEPPPQWQWPTDGEVVVRFGGAGGGIATGIGIGGRDGQQVRAAAAGRVVYAGGGLINYGQLVIIKHNETFLSAYGFNRELLVAQGQDVARGQPIALMGLGPERQARLHFEIRRNGLPVDPLLFVARR